MYVSSSRRQAALIAALALLGMALTASPSQATETRFRARSTFEIIASHGTHTETIGTGHASPGGAFSVTILIHQVGNGDASGVATLDFGDGDTLTYYHEVEWMPELGLLIGPYVITGGTGRFAGAGGSGTVTVDPAGDGTGTFYVDGTLTW